MPEYGSGGGYTVIMEGPFASTGGGTGKLTKISAPVANWKGGTSPYSQVIAMDDISINSKIDIQLSADQIDMLSSQDIAFTVENRSGEVTLVAVGDKPSADCVFQAIASEVLIVGDSDGSVIRGNTVKTTSFPKTGGDMSKPVNMNGKKLFGLNTPTDNDEAATMGFVNQQVRKAAPRNLLDNSAFRNPVMQAGLNGFHGTAKYPIDRWISYDSDITLNDGYISVASPIDQRVSIDIVDAHKKYTAALCLSSGEIRCDCNTFENTIGSYGMGLYCYIPDDDVVEYVVVRIASNMDVKWAALYEGEYTLDTLPGYKSKGYGAELAECMRYYQKSEKTYCTASSNSVIPGVRFPIEMRTTPTITIYDNYGKEGAVTRWTSSDGVKSVSATVATAFTTCIWYLDTSDCANAAVSFSYTASADL